MRKISLFEALSSAFMTARSGGDLGYVVVLKYQDLEAMQSAHNALLDTGDAIRRSESRQEFVARALYEAARLNVSGRPSWDQLNPRDPYDMGMRETAMLQAEVALAASAAALVPDLPALASPGYVVEHYEHSPTLPPLVTCSKCGASAVAFNCCVPGCPVNGGAAYPS